MKDIVITDNNNISKLFEYNGQILERFLPPVMAKNEQEAVAIFIRELREKFNTMSDEEIENEFGLLVYRNS